MSSESVTPRGYGPAQNTWFKNRLCFDGDQRKFELWHVKFMGYLKLRGLKEVVDPSPNPATSTSTIAEASDDGGGVTASARTTTGTGTDPEKNAEVYAELTGFSL